MSTPTQNFKNRQLPSLSQHLSSRPNKFFFSRVVQIINNLGIELGLTPIQIITWQILLYLSNGQDSFPCSYNCIARESSKLDKFNKAQITKKDSPFPCPLDQKGERRLKSFLEAQLSIGVSLVSWISGFGRNHFSTVIIEPSWKIISIILQNCDNNPEFQSHPNLVLRDECAKFAKIFLQSATPQSKKSPEQINSDKCARRQNYSYKLLSDSLSSSLSLQEALDGQSSSSLFLENAKRQLNHWQKIVSNLSTANKNFSDKIYALSKDQRGNTGGGIHVDALNKESQCIGALEPKNLPPEISQILEQNLPKNDDDFSHEIVPEILDPKRGLKGVIDDPFYEKETVDKYTTYENQFFGFPKNADSEFLPKNTPELPPLEQAKNMVDVFQNFGVQKFQITLYKPTGYFPNGKEKKEAEDTFEPTPKDLKNSLPTFLKMNASGLNLGIHPVLPEDSRVKFILLDDLTKEFFNKLKKYGFWGQQTSEKSFHLWLAVEGANNKTFQSIKRRLKAKYGGDPTASYSKICGSLNFKLKYGNSPPRIQKMEVNGESRVVNEAELVADGIIEKEEEKVITPPPVFPERKNRLGEGKKWPDYRISLSGAPLKEDGTPDRSAADFRWCCYAIWKLGWKNENEIARKLMEVSQRATERGWEYSLYTAKEAFNKYK